MYALYILTRQTGNGGQNNKQKKCTFHNHLFSLVSRDKKINNLFCSSLNFPYLCKTKQK